MQVFHSPVICRNLMKLTISFLAETWSLFIVFLCSWDFGDGIVINGTGNSFATTTHTYPRYVAIQLKYQNRQPWLIMQFICTCTDVHDCCASRPHPVRAVPLLCLKENKMGLLSFSQFIQYINTLVFKTNV